MDFGEKLRILRKEKTFLRQNSLKKFRFPGEPSTAGNTKVGIRKIARPMKLFPNSSNVQLNTSFLISLVSWRMFTNTLE